MKKLKLHAKGILICIFFAALSELVLWSVGGNHSGISFIFGAIAGGVVTNMFEANN